MTYRHSLAVLMHRDMVGGANLEDGPSVTCCKKKKLSKTRPESLTTTTIILHVVCAINILKSV